MSEWLVEKLDEFVEFGYHEIQSEGQDFLQVDGRERALLEQNLGSNQDQAGNSSVLKVRERALLEQEDEQDIDNPLEPDWIIEFRQSMPPFIGLFWGGSIENRRREAA